VLVVPEPEDDMSEVHKELAGFLGVRYTTFMSILYLLWRITRFV
jgi:hypothetical protein